MKHKYITSQIMMACLEKPSPKKDIYTQLEETIAERKRIMGQMEDISRKARVIDMYLGVTKVA